MLLYGLHDRQIERVVEWYTSREAAERELAVLLHDEPQWDAELEIVRVEFGGPGVRVERAWVVSPEGRRGRVVRILFGSNPNVPEALAVRTGLFRTKELIFPATDVVEVDRYERRLVLRPGASWSEFPAILEARRARAEEGVAAKLAPKLSKSSLPRRFHLGRTGFRRQKNQFAGRAPGLRPPQNHPAPQALTLTDCSAVECQDSVNGC